MEPVSIVHLDWTCSLLAQEIADGLCLTYELITPRDMSYFNSSFSGSEISPLQFYVQLLVLIWAFFEVRETVTE